LFNELSEINNVPYDFQRQFYTSLIIFLETVYSRIDKNPDHVKQREEYLRALPAAKTDAERLSDGIRRAILLLDQGKYPEAKEKIDQLSEMKNPIALHKYQRRLKSLRRAV